MGVLRRKNVFRGTLACAKSKPFTVQGCKKGVGERKVKEKKSSHAKERDESTAGNFICGGGGGKQWKTGLLTPEKKRKKEKGKQYSPRAIKNIGEN